MGESKYTDCATKSDIDDLRRQIEYLRSDTKSNIERIVQDLTGRFILFLIIAGFLVEVIMLIRMAVTKSP